MAWSSSVMRGPHVIYSSVKLFSQLKVIVHNFLFSYKELLKEAAIKWFSSFLSINEQEITVSLFRVATECKSRTRLDLCWTLNCLMNETGKFNTKTEHVNSILWRNPQTQRYVQTCFSKVLDWKPTANHKCPRYKRAEINLITERVKDMSL